MNFRDEKRKKTEEIEQILKAYLPVQEGKQQVIMEAMEYSLMAGGKRLRPMLLWETFQMFGGAAKTVRPFMAAIEMIHTYRSYTMTFRRWMMMITGEEGRRHTSYTGKTWGPCRRCIVKLCV